MAIGNTSGVDTKSVLPSTNASTSNSNATGDTDKLPATTADAAGKDKIADARKANLLTVSGAKAQFNLSIVQSSLEVSLQTQNDPLSLVYKTAIENINDILRPHWATRPTGGVLARQLAGSDGRPHRFLHHQHVRAVQEEQPGQGRRQQRR